LTENHILFDEAVEKDVLAGLLGCYQAIILPDSAQISSALCAKLDAFVARGGILVSSGRAGLYDEALARREAPPLACLGVERIVYTREDMVSAMFLIRPEEKQIFKSFTNVDALAFGDTLIFQEYAPAARSFFRLLPPQPFGPPERCYGGEPVEYPGIVVHPYGKGKGISIPFLIGSLYYQEGYENSFFLLKDVLTSLCEIQSAAPDLTPMVEITLGANEATGHALLQLVNTSGYFDTSYFKLVPVDGVVVDIPLAEKVLSAQSLVDDRPVPFLQLDGRGRLEVNRVAEFECIKIVTS
jgi:hypothetical protein